MNWNTTPFTNPDLDVFIGRWEGEDYEIKPGEKRYFPSFLSQHFAKQLIEKLFTREFLKDRTLRRDKFEIEMLTQILEPEMNTFSSPQNLTFREIVLEHEKQVKEMLTEEEKKIKAKKIEAMKIIEETKKE